MSPTVYEIITKRIIKSMTAGRIPWRRTWTVVDPANAISGKTYRGINAMLLWEPASNYDSRWFVTARQAEQLGGCVNEYEISNGHIVTFWKMQEPTIVDPDDPENSPRRYKAPVLRYYNVYNIKQCEGLNLPDRCAPDPTGAVSPLPLPQAVFSDYIARENIRMKKGKPAYSPSKDYIMMPPLSNFIGAEAYYSTAYHEAIHSTGHQCRLARFKPDAPLKFGNEVYSKEELVAEIGAAFLCARTGIERPETYENSVAYLQSWIAALENDHRMIVFAASAAQKAADYILPHPSN